MHEDLVTEDPRPSLRFARLRAVARGLGEVVWAGSDVGGPRWPAQPGTTARLLPWAAGIYGLIVTSTASSVVINDSGRMQGGVAFLLLLPYLAGLVLATRRPLDGWRLVTLWLLLTPFLLAPPTGQVPPLEPWQWCLWAPVLLAAAWAEPGRVTAGLGVVSGLVLVLLTFVTPWPVHVALLPVSLLGAAVPLVVGASLGARSDARRALAAEQARVAAAQAERGALAERARIAREMHDVVAHHLSLIAVRCETAPYRLAGLPEPARAELVEVAGTARGALTELQRLLGVLRSGDHPADRAPQPGLGDLTELLAAARDAGAYLAWEIEVGALPDALGLTVFRIVQQALANAGQHAPGAPVRVRIGREGGSLSVQVTNGAAGGGPRAATPGSGAGLLGMRERAELHGGRLDAGPTPDGGFAVRAELPLDPGESR